MSGCVDAAPGSASLEVEIVSGRSRVVSCSARQPFRLLVPVSHGPSVWAFAASFGGGLVAGDRTRLDVALGPGTRCFVGSQSSTKIYRSLPSRPCSHTTGARIGPDAVLVLAPDPVQPFAGAVYSQRQVFHLHPDSGLVLVDCVTAGRTACGERWAFTRYHSRSEIFVGDDRLLLDTMLLDSLDGPISVSHRLDRFNALATVVLVGPALRDIAARCLASVHESPVERGADLLVSASPLRDGVLLRLAAVEPERAAAEIRHRLDFLGSLLGANPWHRRH